jgi:hypothetical protein
MIVEKQMECRLAGETNRSSRRKPAPAPLLSSLTLREEYRLRVFENRVLRRIFGPRKDEVTGG